MDTSTTHQVEVTWRTEITLTPDGDGVLDRENAGQVARRVREPVSGRITITVEGTLDLTLPDALLDFGRLLYGSEVTVNAHGRGVEALIAAVHLSRRHHEEFLDETAANAARREAAGSWE
ncbi:hypothetical protein [Herbidospora daliensis]|uniref:hypothetical protein n=1 Tax=Herbidospora daliensis TaxID=295585 RepID=UPI000782A93D|nr:hypothetical protein [Herbidospora daliensis]